MIRHHRNNSGDVTGANAPQMEVGNPITTLFEPLGDFRRQSGIGRNVEQNRACRPYKAPRPAHDDDRSDETHEGIHPNPPKLTPRHKTNDH